MSIVSKTRTNQGGSVVNFVIVGIVLTAVVLGAIYFVQQRGEDGSRAPIASSPSPSPDASPSSSPRPSNAPNPGTPSPSPSAVPSTGRQLPETGPTEDLFVTTTPLAVVVAMTLAYRRSRQALN